jgi:hypothetical protein
MGHGSHNQILRSESSSAVSRSCDVSPLRDRARARAANIGIYGRLISNAKKALPITADYKQRDPVPTSVLDGNVHI